MKKNEKAAEQELNTILKMWFESETILSINKSTRLKTSLDVNFWSVTKTVL